MIVKFFLSSLVCATTMKCVILLVFVGVWVFALAEALQSDKKNGLLAHMKGGVQVHPLTRPYTIKILLSNNYEVVKTCGGARVGSSWFITAAECLDKNKYTEVQFLYPADLEAKTSRYNSRMQILKTLSVYVHPNYNDVTKANNIALVMCIDCHPTPKTFASITLPRKSEIDATFAGSTAIVSGWTVGNRTVSKYHKIDEVFTSYKTSIVNPFWCKLAYFFISVRSDHICASSAGGKRITQDDVGVPLVVEEDTEIPHVYKLVGIASSVRPWSNFLPVPIVFTSVASHLEWINNHTYILLRD